MIALTIVAATAWVVGIGIIFLVIPTWSGFDKKWSHFRRLDIRPSRRWPDWNIWFAVKLLILAVVVVTWPLWLAVVTAVWLFRKPPTAPEIDATEEGPLTFLGTPVVIDENIDPGTGTMWLMNGAERLSVLRKAIRAVEATGGEPAEIHCGEDAFRWIMALAPHAPTDGGSPVGHLTVAVAGTSVHLKRSLPPGQIRVMSRRQETQ